jgi:Flp pilus assembly protein TadD
VCEQLGLLYGEMGRIGEAGQSLREAVALDPRSASAHEALGLWHESVNDLEGAEREYRESLRLDGHRALAAQGLERARARP